MLIQHLSRRCTSSGLKHLTMRPRAKHIRTCDAPKRASALKHSTRTPRLAGMHQAHSAPIEQQARSLRGSLSLSRTGPSLRSTPRCRRAPRADRSTPEALKRIACP